MSPSAAAPRRRYEAERPRTPIERLDVKTGVQLHPGPITTVGVDPSHPTVPFDYGRYLLAILEQTGPGLGVVINNGARLLEDLATDPDLDLPMPEIVPAYSIALTREGSHPRKRRIIEMRDEHDERALPMMALTLALKDYFPSLRQGLGQVCLLTQALEGDPKLRAFTTSMLSNIIGNVNEDLSEGDESNTVGDVLAAGVPRRYSGLSKPQRTRHGLYMPGQGTVGAYVAQRDDVYATYRGPQGQRSNNPEDRKVMPGQTLSDMTRSFMGRTARDLLDDKPLRKRILEKFIVTPDANGVSLKGQPTDPFYAHGEQIPLATLGADTITSALTAEWWRANVGMTSAKPPDRYHNALGSVVSSVGDKLNDDEFHGQVQTDLGADFEGIDLNDPSWILNGPHAFKYARQFACETAEKADEHLRSLK
ncbi:hypothetical protein KBD59_03380 [Candidatus Gracilibacteria bacterium]|nr:hypothetical protein [Candidatus Gracilibacteria bacterium]